MISIRPGSLALIRTLILVLAADLEDDGRMTLSLLAAWFLWTAT